MHMGTLHILQGGIKNGDKKWLEKAARQKLDAASWVTPKSSKPGDDVIIYVRDYGFFATATIKSFPKPRPDWPNRYGAGLTSIRLIEPAISLSAIRRNIPELKWAIYPRSITTLDPYISGKIRNLISLRRKTGIPDLEDEALIEANIDELRKVALLKARQSVTAKEQKALYRARSLAIKLYVLRRSKGVCEGCHDLAPFQKPDGSPYLEPHHTLKLADDGPDHPKHVIALCPNCHRRAHYAADAKAFN
jgi:5-methylcytosine-specific restriction endonuclease McrA